MARDFRTEPDCQEHVDRIRGLIETENIPREPATHGLSVRMQLHLRVPLRVFGVQAPDLRLIELLAQDAVGQCVTVDGGGS